MEIVYFILGTIYVLIGTVVGTRLVRYWKDYNWRGRIVMGVIGVPGWVSMFLVLSPLYLLIGAIKFCQMDVFKFKNPIKTYVKSIE